MERTSAQQQREIARLRKTSERLRGFGATRVRQRIAVDKRVAALEQSKPDIPQTSRRMKIDFPVRQASGRLVVQANRLAKSYGPKEVFHDLSFQTRARAAAGGHRPERRGQDDPAAHPAGPDPA